MITTIFGGPCDEPVLFMANRLSLFIALNWMHRLALSVLALLVIILLPLLELFAFLLLLLMLLTLPCPIALFMALDPVVDW